jgi:phosphatidate phosphatase APP1
MKEKAEVKIYHGFGHTHNMHVYGHVFKKRVKPIKKGSSSFFTNTYNLIKLFFVEPIPHINVSLLSQQQQLDGKTEDDGFFKFEWESDTHIAAGWHTVQVHTTDKSGRILDKAGGEVFIPHITQYGFISDIDDTILVSHSGTVRKRLKELFIKSPETRELFNGVADHYRLLAAAHTEDATPNPFFYVSSSEWNLYDYLHTIFLTHKLPEGVFLLNQVKRWYQVFRTGKTNHDGKLLRILRIVKAFPNQQFVLLGDNSQRDPEIYKALVDKYPQHFYAVYIRNVSNRNEGSAASFLTAIREKGKHTCLFKTSDEAIGHSRSIGLIEKPDF